MSYATKVCATVEADDPGTAEVARVALLPIANHREAAAGRAARAPGAPAEPEAPKAEEPAKKPQ